MGTELCPGTFSSDNGLLEACKLGLTLKVLGNLVK